MTRACLALALVVSGAALAQSDDQLARKRYADGDTAFRLGQYPQAIEAFEDAYRLSHRPEILYNIGLSYRRAYSVDGEPEHLRRAIDMYESFLRLSSQQSQRAVTEQLVKDLRQQLAAVEERERLARVRNVTSPELQEAVKVFVSGKGPEALEQLDAFLQAGGHPQALTEDIFRLQGEIAAETGQPAQAQDAFKKLLALSPGFVPATTASKAVKAAVAEASSWWKGRPALHVSHTAPPPAAPDAPASLAMSVDQDPMLMIAKATVHYRRVGRAAYSSVLRNGPGELFIPSAELPASTDGYRVEYYIEAADRFGNVLATIGDERVPLSFAVLSKVELERRADAARPWYRRPWVWGLTAAGVAGVTVGALLLSQRGAPASDYGVVQTLPR